MTTPDPVTCRHCGKPLRRVSDDPRALVHDVLWEDPDGVVGCIRGAPGWRELVLHQPMPAGLRGGPAG